MPARIHHVDITAGPTLEDHALIDGEAQLVTAFIARGRELAGALGTGRVWMLNSTSAGGGVAEMLPSTCRLLRDVGVDARWLVLEPDDERFFSCTKSLHNMLHGKHAGPSFDAASAACFEHVAREGARALVEIVEPGDVIVVHDPQPCAVPSFLPTELRARLIWRCHVGVPFNNAETDAAWAFLERWLAPYQKLLFSSERYIPRALHDRSSVMQPAIDPLSHKNRELRPYKHLGILRSAGLIPNGEPHWGRFTARAERYVEGAFHVSPLAALLNSPMILQVSRFDALKGMGRSIDAFRVLVEQGVARSSAVRAASERAHDELARSILILAGPNPFGVADDPEALAVLHDLCTQRDALPPAVAARAHIFKLPMTDRKENALMVNALQRLAAVIIQPSVEEGFGLTVTEALWKGAPVIASNVGGISLQMRPGVDGFVVDDPKDSEGFASALVEALTLPTKTARMGWAGRRRVAEHFLVVREAMQWLDVIATLVSAPSLLDDHRDEPATGARTSSARPGA